MVGPVASPPNSLTNQISLQVFPIGQDDTVVVFFFFPLSTPKDRQNTSKCSLEPVNIKKDEWTGPKVNKITG